MSFVAILMGSDSDLSVMENAIKIFQEFEVPFEVKITSAHRTPDETHRYVKDADKRGAQAFIAAAGLAAHLAGVVASLTIKPVIGVPIDAGPLNGLDALLSTVQMPGGVPVASMGIGKHGAKNAAYFALSLMALHNDELSKKINSYREDQQSKIISKSSEINKRFNQ